MHSYAINQAFLVLELPLQKDYCAGIKAKLLLPLFFTSSSWWQWSKASRAAQARTFRICWQAWFHYLSISQLALSYLRGFLTLLFTKKEENFNKKVLSKNSSNWSQICNAMLDCKQISTIFFAFFYIWVFLLKLAGTPVYLQL